MVDNKVGILNIHLNKHVIDDKEEIDDFRCHDKDDKAPS